MLAGLAPGRQGGAGWHGQVPEHFLPVSPPAHTLLHAPTAASPPRTCWCPPPFSSRGHTQPSCSLSPRGLS